MRDDRSQPNHVLYGIVKTIGIEIADFWSEDGEIQAAHEALAMITAFARVINQGDRRSCIDFVEEAAQRHKAHT